jgi:formate hydrogenlyase subunit 3/multisubunit Na+/H+ antiporter MnhD subunit
MELVTIVAYVVVIAGGKRRRENGWRVVAFLCGLVGLLLCASVAIVVSSIH